VADEEHASVGTADLVGRYPVDGAIVTEPTSLEICIAHKGFVWIEVETLGRAAHGSRPELGVDANLHMGRILARLDSLERALRSRAAHPLLGPGSLHAALLHGGTGMSTYAARCVLGIERRTVPGESEAAVVAEVQELLDALRAEDPAFDARLASLMARPPFEAVPSSALVRTLAAVAQDVLGHAPRQRGDTPWMDAALLADAGVDTVVFGPHGAGAHAAEEWVDLASVHRTSEVLAHAAIAYCG
jgi:acetylornithine deacetylase